MSVVPYHNMDPECVQLCRALNKLPGVTTTESCCGHDKGPFRIWFRVEDLKNLPDLLYRFSPCHSGCYGWKVTAHTDCARSPVSFMIQGPQGEEGYTAANKIASLILGDIKESGVPA